MTEMLVCTLKSHRVNSLEQMRWAVETAKSLVGMKLAPLELLDAELAPALLWDSEEGRERMVSAGLNPTSLDAQRLKTAVNRLTRPEQTSAATPVGAFSGSAHTPGSYGDPSPRTSTAFTTQLATVFAPEIEKGFTYTEMVASLVSCS